MNKITIISSSACKVEVNTTDEDGNEVIEYSEGIEVTVLIEYELSGEEKSETQTYRFATSDAEEVKTKLTDILTELTSTSSKETEKETEEASKASSDETEYVEGLEAGVTIEV